MKKVIVLPGTPMQIPLIKKLKERGYYTVSFHPIDNFATLPYSDEYALLDISKLDSCLLETQKVQPHAILSDECDIAMPAIAYLSGKMNLPALTNNDASLYTDKSLMREFCTQHSIPSPAYCKCKTIEEAKHFFKSINARCILKPLNANSSKGVFVINKEEDIDRYWGDSMSYSKSSGTLLIEQYVDGIEFTIDGLVTSRGHVSLAISEKRHYEYNPSIAFELFFSNYNEKFDYDALRKINDYYVDSSSLPIGYLTHAEYKYTDGQFYLIEIAARGGGNYISSDIVPLMSGVDNYSYMIDSLVEHRTDLEVCIDETLRDRCAVLYFFDVPFEGVVKEIKGLEILSNNPNVVRFELHFKVGDTIQRAKNDSARVGYYIAYADNKQALRLLMKKINDTLKIIVE